MQRRRFLREIAHTSALSAVSLAAARAQGAGERVRVGWIGCGGRGRFVAERFRQVPDVEIVAVCDVYETNRLRAKDWVGPRCRDFGDFRDLLDQSDIDAVLIATPDHWHAIPTVLACQAGKDVYVEKPLGHNIREGQAMVRAARENGRVVQVGTQQRSAGHFAQMREIIGSGELGAVHFVRIWNYRNTFPEGIGRVTDSEPPDGLDWDFYLGPAPLVPFNRNRFLGRFRWFFDYSGGVITDWGVHRLDSMHQVMGVDTPRTVSAAGGRFAIDDGGDIPDLLQVTYEYPDFVVSYEATLLSAHGMGGRTAGRSYYRANGLADRPNGLAFYGTNGALFADRLGFEIFPELTDEILSKSREERQKLTAADSRMRPQTGSSPDSTLAHVTNFIDCIRSRQAPAADVAIGHRSTTAAHLGNIAYKTGHKLHWDADGEQFAGDPDATTLLSREARTPWDLIS